MQFQTRSLHRSSTAIKRGPNREQHDWINHLTYICSRARYRNQRFAAELAPISYLLLCSLFDHGVQNSKKKCSFHFSGLTCIISIRWAQANSAICILLSPPRFAAQEHLSFVLVVESWIKSVQPGMTKNCHFLLLLLLLM